MMLACRDVPFTDHGEESQGYKATVQSDQADSTMSKAMLWTI